MAENLSELALLLEEDSVPGRVPVFIELDEDPTAEHGLPGGLYGQAAVYSDYVHQVAVMRRVLLRMAGWMNYVYPLH